MKKIRKALKDLSKARPETDMWSIQLFSDGSGSLIDSKHETVYNTLWGIDAPVDTIINIIKGQIRRA